MSVRVRRAEERDDDPDDGGEMATATKEATDTVEARRDEVLEGVEEFVGKIRERVGTYLPHLRPALEIAAEFPGIARPYQDGPLDAVDIGYVPGQTKGVRVNWHRCEDLRQVRPMLRSFARRGYRVKRTSDFADVGRRSWLLAHDDDPDTTVIRVQAFVSTDEGAACKVVETEEMRPVKKIVCPDDDPIAPLAPDAGEEG